MEFFFYPRGIALVGATPNQKKGGYAIFSNLIKGFTGAIHPVNPSYNEIEGQVCYPTVRHVPDPVDLAIVFVPALHVPRVVQECADRGIRGVMIESGGFAETGPSGRALQDELKAIAARTGIRLWGPNCMGLVDAVHRHVFSFVSPAIWADGLPVGRVSLIVQSGMLSAGFLIDTMSHGIMGVSKVCSIGNKVDVNECDLLEYLIQDPHTGAVGLYLESIPDGRRFLDLCRRSTKPIVVLKGGKSEKGAQAAMSHTASLAGNGALISGVLAQVGVVEANDFKQMMDLCRALSLYPEVRPDNQGRIAVLTFSGGAGIVSSDFVEQFGLRIADLSPVTKETLKTVFPEWMPPSNPVDLWPAVEQVGTDRAYGTAVRAVLTDPEVDAVFVHVFSGGFELQPDVDALAVAAQQADKPMFFWLLGRRDEARKLQLRAQELGIPVFREIYRSVECMAPVLRRKSSRRRADGTGAEPARMDYGAIGAGLQARPAGVLDEYDAKQVLAAAGIPVVDEIMVSSVSDARTAADRLGYPVVLKGLAPGQVHKTEKGLVRLGIADAQSLSDHYRALVDLLPGDGRIVLQKQIVGDLELIVGFLRDPQFGPCVMCGLGGVLAEVIGETRFAAAPLTREEALELIENLGAGRLLDGYRGAPPVDRAAVADVLVCLGELGRACPRIMEIDVNPLIIRAGRPVAVDATVVMAP